MVMMKNITFMIMNLENIFIMINIEEGVEFNMLQLLF